MRKNSISSRFIEAMTFVNSRTTGVTSNQMKKQLGWVGNAASAALSNISHKGLVYISDHVEGNKGRKRYVYKLSAKGLTVLSKHKQGETWSTATTEDPKNTGTVTITFTFETGLKQKSSKANRPASKASSTNTSKHLS